MIRQIRISKGVLLAGFASVCLAQPVLAAEAAATDADSGKLDEIVVTAQKREENLQKAPLAITAISAAQLELRGLNQVKDLSSIAPNVSVVGATTNATASVVSIRGIPSAADETQGYDSPIGIYLDGVYIARSSASTFEVADVERVEVLRGPQGTLFGRNTTGGAINFITKKPSADTNLKVSLSGGNYGMSSGKVILNTGDIGALRMSLGYYHHHRDGVVDNLLVPKNVDPGADTTDSFRFAATIGAGTNFEVTNIVDYTNVRATAYVMQLAAVGDGTFRPNVTLNGNTFTAVQPANVAGYLNAATSLTPGCGKTVTRVYQSSLCDTTGGQSTDKIFGDMLRMELKLDGITIRSTTAYREWRNRIEPTDLDGLGPLRGPLFSNATVLNGLPLSTLSLFQPAGTAAFLASQAVPTTTQPLFSADNTRGQHQFSQELELISNNDGDLSWVLGGFYFKERGYETNIQSIGFVLDTNQAVFTSTSFGALAPLLQAGNPARFRIVPQSSTLAYTAGGESVAVYGQASYRPSSLDNKLGITLGLRYTWDKKNVERTQNGAVAFSAAELVLNKQNAKFSAPTGNLTIDYRASDDVNLYARVAKGYRSGGFNLRQSTQLDNPATATINETVSLIPFNEEKIWSYEIGAKMEFLNRFRLNFSAFHNVYSDQLVTVPIPITGGGSFGTQVINAGKTTYNGFEVEAMAKVTDFFTLDGNFGYLDAKIKDFPSADTTGAIRNIAPLIAGVGYAPKYTLNVGGTVSYPVGNAKMTARLGYSYTSQFEMFANTLTAPFQVADRGDARGLLDGQLKLENFGVGNKMSLTIWGKNLTNKHYVTRSVDFGQLGFATVIFGEPRTFGATLHAEF